VAVYGYDREPTEAFFDVLMRNARNHAGSDGVPIRVRSHCKEDPHWVRNDWGAKDTARKRPEGQFDDPQAATRWVLDKKLARLAEVPTDSATVVRLDDTEADYPAAVRLAFFSVTPTLVVSNQEAGTLHAVWLTPSPAKPLSERFARRLSGRATKLIPVPGTIAHSGVYEYRWVAGERPATRLLSELNRR
jgi:hypothetical protein